MSRNDEITKQASVSQLFTNWIEKLSNVFQNLDRQGFENLFVAEGHWRDILSFSWEHRTFSGLGNIGAAFTQAALHFKGGNFRIATGRTAPKQARRAGRDVVEGYFDFETALGRGTGFARLVQNDADPVNMQAWILLTTLREIHGFEEKAGSKRPSGDEYSQNVSPLNWKQKREKAHLFEHRDPKVVIVGAGHSGLMLAARLQHMGIETLVVDRSERVGDVWRKRYNSLTLHNEIIANHFPYVPFPETWPMWLPKDMMAMWLESYAHFLELNVWTSTSLEESEFDEAKGEWLIKLKRADGELRELRCRHVVIATGVSGDVPKKPSLAGEEHFKGNILHSSEFKSGLDWVGRHALVVGTGNSGHDVAQDLYVSGAATVSIMQRGPTCVASLRPSASLIYAAYKEGRPVEDTDLMAAATPYPLMVQSYQWITKRTREYDKELIAGLHAVGFKTHNGEDETGFQMMYLRGAGRYYIDVGCCQLIADQKINLIQADQVDRLETDGVLMKDGSRHRVDLIVMATGFESIHAGVARVLGQKVADKIGPVWGFDEDHVMRNMWRRTAQQGVWLMGGALTEARTYSRFLALEIVADLQGYLPSAGDTPLIARPQKQQRTTTPP